MGANRVGICISPNFNGFGLIDDEGEESSLHLATELKRIGVAYLHLAEDDWAGGASLPDGLPLRTARGLRRFDHRLRTDINSGAREPAH